MKSQESAYARFRRALKTGNMAIIRSAAGELPHDNLGDALAVCLVIHKAEPDRFEGAALRREQPPATPLRRLHRLTATDPAVRARTRTKVPVVASGACSTAWSSVLSIGKLNEAEVLRLEGPHALAHTHPSKRGTKRRFVTTRS